MRKLKKLFTKIGFTLGAFLLMAGVTYAAFSLTFSASAGNKVTAASANLQVTSGTVNAENLLPGASAPATALTIKNTGSLVGTVTLNVTGPSGTLCPDLKIDVTGDATGSFDPIAAGSISLGTLNPGATLNLSQTVTRKASSTSMGNTCNWNETVTLSGS